MNAQRRFLALGGGGALLIAIVLLCLASAPAQAETYCAPGPCGEGTEVATIKDAVKLADENAGPDTVAIQPGIYETPLEGCGGLFVTQEDTHVRGAGIDQTILTFPPLEPEDGFTRRVICGYMHLSDLTLRLPSAVTPEKNSSVEGLDLYGGLVERVKVDAVGATFGPDINDGMAEAMLLRNGAAREIEIDFDPGLDTRGIATGYLTELRDITVRAKRSALFSRVAQEPGQPPMRVSRLYLQSQDPLGVSNESGIDARMELSDAVLDASGTPPSEPSRGASVYNGLPPESIQLAMDRVTIVGNGAPESVAISADGQGEPLPTVLEGRHLAVSGFEKTLLAGKFGGDVVVAIDYSNLDSSPAAIAEEGTEGVASITFGPGNRSGDPLFVAPGDYRLSLGSPAIDIGGEDLVPGEATDLAGNPRPADGDADGLALNDAGAFEHETVFPRSPVDASPKLWALRINPVRFASRGRKRGATVRYRLSESARVVFRIQRRLPGRVKQVRGKRRCVRQTRGLVEQRAKKCARFKQVGGFGRAGRAGLNRFRFSGWIKRKALAPGPYRLLARATDSDGRKSKLRKRGFRVIRVPR